MEPYRRDLKQPARQLRARMTDAEQKLWQRLRRKQIQGALFYRQKPILSFIVDFYCPAAQLVIELDGSQHDTAEYVEKDRERDLMLKNLGLKVIRLNNSQVLTQIESVIAAINAEVEPVLLPMALEDHPHVGQ